MRKKDKLINIMKTNIMLEQRVKINKLISENSDTYFETLSSALDFVRTEVIKMGYTLNEDDIWINFGTGGVSYGETKSANIGLLKDGEPIISKSGKPLNRAIRIVIYRMDSGRYELTYYKTW